MLVPEKWQTDLVNNVEIALAEDIQDGDITAELIPASNTMKARVITRDDAVIAGMDWVNEVFRQFDSDIDISANPYYFQLAG